MLLTITIVMIVPHLLLTSLPCMTLRSSMMTTRGGSIKMLVSDKKSCFSCLKAQLALKFGTRFQLLVIVQPCICLKAWHALKVIIRLKEACGKPGTQHVPVRKPVRTMTGHNPRGNGASIFPPTMIL